MKDDKNFSSSSESINDDVIDENLELNEKNEDENSILEQLNEKKLELEKEVDDLKNKLLRVSAEYDNFRKRTSKEKGELYGNACLDVITQLLPILDNLERAVLVDSDFDSFKKGIDMVINLFRDNLKRLGVEEINTLGEFDPNLHEAVAHVSDDNFGKNTIVEVLQKGYIRNEKVIRHSIVKVAN